MALENTHAGNSLGRSVAGLVPGTVAVVDWLGRQPNANGSRRTVRLSASVGTHNTTAEAKKATRLIPGRNDSGAVAWTTTHKESEQC